MEGLHARAGQEALFISVRTDRDHYAKPFFLASSSKVEDHFKKTTGMMPGNYAAKLEVFCLDGLTGALPTSRLFFSLIVNSRNGE